MSKFRVFRTVGRSGMGGGVLESSVIECPEDVPGAESVDESTPLSDWAPDEGSILRVTEPEEAK